MAKTRVEEVVGRHALRTIQSADDDAMYVAATGRPCGGLPMALASLVPRPVSYPRCGWR